MEPLYHKFIYCANQRFHNHFTCMICKAGSSFVVPSILLFIMSKTKENPILNYLLRRTWNVAGNGDARVSNFSKLIKFTVFLQTM